MGFTDKNARLRGGMTVNLDLVRAYGLFAFAYMVALVVAAVAAFAFDLLHPILVALIADVAATLVIFAFSTTYANSSFYDPYWSVAPIAIAVFWAMWAENADIDIHRQVLSLSLVIAWGVRLTFNWARRWEGMGHEDWRYVDLRQKAGPYYWIVDLLGIHLFPTIQVFLGCLALYPAVSSGSNEFNALDVFAVVLGIAAVVIETTADNQLQDFVKHKQPGEIMRNGLWAYSRHPNYFGEILFWWSLWLFALAADWEWWWTVIGPVAITLMFVYASVPMIDKRHIERRPGYEDHMRRISAIVPWLPND